MTPKRETDADVIVIGGGLGGLSAAAMLSKAGLETILLEQFHKTGGLVSGFEREGYHFETAIRFLPGANQGGKLKRLLDETGVGEGLDFVRHETLFSTVMPDFRFSLPANIPSAQAAMIEKWPKEEEAIRAFFLELASLHRELAKMEERRNTGGVTRFFTDLFASWVYPVYTAMKYQSVEAALEKRFQSETLRHTLAQHWLYWGQHPKEIPAFNYFDTFYSYLKYGAYRIREGNEAFARSFDKAIESHGGKILTGRRVIEIELMENRVHAVKTALKERFTARYVVSAIAPDALFGALLPKHATPPAPLSNKQAESSFVQVYLGLDAMPAVWGHKGEPLFYTPSRDPYELIEPMYDGAYFPAPIALTFFGHDEDIHKTPSGKSILVLQTLAKAQAWPERREQYRLKKRKTAEQLIRMAKMVLPEIDEHIRQTHLATPHTFHAYTLRPDGVTNAYGNEFAPLIETNVEGLYLAGSHVATGWGATETIRTGTSAARAIIEREQR